MSYIYVLHAIFMRALLLILLPLVCFLNCKQKKQKSNTEPILPSTNHNRISMTESAWISRDIIFDSVDLGEKDYMIYGFATILKFRSDGKVLAISCRFEFEQDTVFWGEGNGNFMLGQWNESPKNIFIKGKYIDPSEDSILGKVLLDTFTINKNLLLSSKGQYFRPAKYFSIGLSELIYEEEWLE